MNFYIGNSVVVVPTYGSANDAAAVDALAALFPDRRAVGIDARGIIVGGGRFHCSSQPLPASGGPEPQPHHPRIAASPAPPRPAEHPRRVGPPLGGGRERRQGPPAPRPLPRPLFLPGSG